MNIPIEGEIEFIRGGSFDIEAELETGPVESPAPVVVNVADMKSQLRDKKGELLAELNISSFGLAPGTYLLSSEANTSEWPIKQYYLDVRVEISDRKRLTRRWAINVLPEVTKDDPVDPGVP